MGPVTKLLAGAENMHLLDEAPTWIVTLDDDIAYACEHVPTLLQCASTVRDCLGGADAVVGGHGQTAQFFGLRAWDKLPNKMKQTSIPNQLLDTFLKRDILEGFAGVVYPAHAFLDGAIANTLRSFVSNSRACYLSDDLVLSACMRKHGIPIYNTQLLDKTMYSLSHGRNSSTALHVMDKNGVKYNKALEYILQQK